MRHLPRGLVRGMLHRSGLHHILWLSMKLLLVALVPLSVLFFVCQWLVVRTGAGRLYTDVDDVPKRDVGLLLGTSQKLGNGDENWFFNYRISAATQLYKAGKIRHLLVSGDNHTRGYDEPAMMTQALLASGVPQSAITVDDAGFRTLDSVVRARKVFDLQQFTIISQRFHNQRALLIADHYGADAIGFCANDVEFRYCMRIYFRKAFARVKVVLDLYVLRTRPRYLGPPIKI